MSLERRQPEPRSVPRAEAGVAPLVEVRRSRRRRRTVSAYRDGDTIVVQIPDRFSRAEQERWTASMVADVLAREQRARRRGARSGDAALQARAEALANRYLAASVPKGDSAAGRAAQGDAAQGDAAQGAVLPASVRWVATMTQRWASCTPSDASIRLSDRLRECPDWVVDYVLVHELAHLRVPGHGPDFWELVDRYPRTERARGFLEGLSAARAGHVNTDDGLPAPDCL